MLKRSESSSLSDTELVLVDPMFNAFIPLNALRATNYASAFNVPYSHSLSDEALGDALSMLVDKGVVRKLQRSERTVYGLTDKGGATWETERGPDWLAYCFVAMLPGSSKTRLEITTFSQHRAESFLRLAAERQIIGALPREDFAWKTKRPSQIYWKRDLLPRCATIVTESKVLSVSAFAGLAAAESLWGSLSDLKRS